nr:DUF2931 family protein [Pedobacter sp. ASV2]
MFKERENIINVVLAAILGIIIIANIVKMKNYRAGDRFEWSSGVYTKPGNTIQVANCTFFYANNWNYEINKTKILNTGREDINYTEKGLEKAFYPDSLDICWYSYTERKFYGGKFLLPYKLINDLARQLRNTTKSYNIEYARANPDKIQLYFFAEVLPGGKITTWLSDLDKYIEIGKHQAKPVNKTWEIFNSNYGNNTEKVNIATQTALVMEEYPHSVKFLLPDSLKALTIDPFNQVRWELDKEKPRNIPIFKNIPKEIDFTWGNKEKEYWVQWYFKDEEILSAFKKLQSLPGNSEPILLITVNDKNDKVVTSLKKGNTIIELHYAYDQFQIYDRTPKKEDE